MLVEEHSATTRLFHNAIVAILSTRALKNPAIPPILSTRQTRVLTKPVNTPVPGDI